jgi:YesN/AraC family two-component response regulator
MEMDVTNDGVGIPKDKQATIFNRYDVLNRFEKALQKGRTSNGIGLALCQSLVELHNGHIEIISDGLTYTCFHVSVPHLEPDTSLPVFSGSAAIQESRADIPPEEEAPMSARPAAETVLVVDDDDSVREFVTGILSPRFNVVAASGAEEALRLMAQSEPKIVVSDLAMPGMDGLQLRAKMREDERLGHIPFILLTGESAVDTQIKALEGGVDAYIAKPFHPRHLLARIERVLSRDTEVIRYSQSAQASVEKVAGKEIKKADKALLTSITDIILANLDKESLNADIIAGELNISKVQLYRKLKATVDMTTTEYIRSVRLEQAQHLLTTGNMSVQEIMYACGFVTKTYFYREFQKKYGATPGEFRRSQKS